MLGFSFILNLLPPCYRPGAMENATVGLSVQGISAFRAQDAPEITKAIRYRRGIPRHATSTGYDPSCRRETLKAGPEKDRPWDPPGFLNADSSAQRAKTYRKKAGRSGSSSAQDIRSGAAAGNTRDKYHPQGVIHNQLFYRIPARSP